VLLQGNLRQFNLPNILQLVKMSANTGALSLRSGDAFGKIFFSNGAICYAFVTPQSVPIGQRFVNARYITPAQLLQASAVQRESPGSGRLGAVLLDQGLIETDALEAVVREQIQDTVFDFFSWPDGEFEFNDDEVAGEQDIFVEMQVEGVIMESCRRIDELEFILEQLGSLEAVPRLARGSAVDEFGEVNFTAEEWNCAIHIDGRTDINTILRDCDFDRFHGAQLMRELFARGLITVAKPGVWDITESVSVALRGPADFYNEIFLTTLTDANIVKQLRVEIIADEEVDIPIVAGCVPKPDRETADDNIFVFSVAASAPEAALKRLAGGASAWVLLADACDPDSVAALRAEIDLIASLGAPPTVVATYSSAFGQGLSPQQVAEALGLGPDIPVVPCRLRDRDAVMAVVDAVVQRLPDPWAMLEG
jgi:hypothetical protein